MADSTNIRERFDDRDKSYQVIGGNHAKIDLFKETSDV